MNKLFSSRRFWIGIAISLVCLWLAIRNVPFAEFSQVITRANYLWLIPAILLQLGAIWGRAQRWRALLNHRPGVWLSIWSHSIGFLFTNVFPLRMGEPARVIVMSERSKIPLVQVAATALVERVLDVAFVVLALVAVLPFMQVPALVSQAGVTFGILVLVALIGLWFVVRFRPLSERMLAAILARLTFLPGAAIQARWGELVEGLSPLTRLNTGLSAIIWTLISWFFSISIYWCVLKSFQSDARVVEAVFIVVALALAITVPSSPGFIGIFQYVGQQALVLPFGDKYTESNALAITLTSHLVYYIMTTGIGLIALTMVGESFANLGKLITSQQKPKPASTNE